MTIHLEDAAAVLTACAFALLLLPPFRGKKVTSMIVGGAWALLAVLLIIDSVKASA